MYDELISDEEIENFLTSVFEKYGYDFTSYSKASVKRRLIRLLQLDNFENFSSFTDKVIDDDAYLTRFVQELTVNVTEMFRDPGFYKVLRGKSVARTRHPSFHPYLACRLFNRGGGLFNGHPIERIQYSS